MEWESLIGMGTEVYHWFLAQPLPLQVVLGIGLLSVGYFFIVLLRMLLVALAAAFRGL